MAQRVLTQRELNRALLARQLLLERSTLSIPRALERMGGIQNQYAPNAYVRLWSCLEGFRREQLTHALERRTVVQGTLMRTTIHTVSAREYWLFAAGLGRAAREWQLRVDKTPARLMRKRAAKLRAALLSGPVRANELDGRAQLWEDIVRVPPSGTWERRRADLYGLAEQWLGPAGASEDDGFDHVVRSYLRGFGPAALDDVSSWSGVPARMLAPALERLRLRRFRDEQGRELVDLPRAPLPPPDTPAPVRFLPWWDAVLLVHARRTGVMPEEYRPIVFATKNPPSVPTFLVDGRVAGAWRYDDGSSGAGSLRAAVAPRPRRAASGGRPPGVVHGRRRMSVTPSRTVSSTDSTRGSFSTCSLKSCMRSPSSTRPPRQRVVGGDHPVLGELRHDRLVVADIALLVGVDEHEVEGTVKPFERLSSRAEVDSDAIGETRRARCNGAPPLHAAR